MIPLLFAGKERVQTYHPLTTPLFPLFPPTKNAFQVLNNPYPLVYAAKNASETYYPLTTLTPFIPYRPANKNRTPSGC